VSQGIEIRDGQIPFEPRWGGTRHDTGLLASTPAANGSLEKVHVAVVSEGIVLVPCEGIPERELVLVQQYGTGTGAKRWPGFRVELGSESRKLSEAFTRGGSGSETWVLISAPLGWAQNIADQFVDRRDEADQCLSYKEGGE